MPKSKKRKPRKQGRGGSASPPGAVGKTPQLVVGKGGGLAQQLGMTLSPESQLISWHMHLWQAYMQDAPANLCILASLTLRDSLSKVAIPAEPISVVARVDFYDGKKPAMIGDEEPVIHGKSWSGHLALWLPSLNRFFDPTIYQVNAHGRGKPFPTGIIIQLPYREAIRDAGVSKEGALVTYDQVPAHAADSWRPASRQPALLSEVRRASSAIHSGLRRMLREDPESQLMASRLTSPEIAEAVARLIR